MISRYPQQLQLKDSISGQIEDALSHHQFAINVPYIEAIGLGAVSGHTPFRGLGRREALSAAVGGDDVWDGVATTISVPNQSTGQQMAIRSTSVNDTAAGTNVQQVDIHYLDASGNPQVETVTLNGTTLVNTVATDIRWIQYIHSQRLGSFGQTAAGDITCENTAGTVIYSIIKAGGNLSLSSARMVPAGKNFYLTYVTAGAVSNKPVSLRLRATCDFEGVLTSGIFLFNEIFELQDSAVFVNFTPPKKIPEFAIIKGTAYSTSAGGACSVSYGGFIE